MKKKHVISLSVVVLGLCIWFIDRWSNSSHDPENRATVGNTAPSQPALKPSRPKRASGYSVGQGDESGDEIQRKIAERSTARERSQQEWRTPVEFFAIVLDEQELPVEGVDVEFTLTDLSQEGHSVYRTKSDEHGYFSLGGVKGKGLNVKISKDGYDVSKTNKAHFFYAGENENFKPDVGNRVVFRVRKKAKAEPMLSTTGRLKVPLDARSKEIDLKTGLEVAQGRGHLRLECVSDAQGKAGKQYDWKLLLSIPDGGIRESTNEFEIEAPEPPYDSRYMIQMSSKDPSWTEVINRKFFIQLADGNFARIEFSFIAYNGVFRFQCFLNPSGSRNLEFDPKLKIQ